jgi:hypothetical protein
MNVRNELVKLSPGPKADQGWFAALRAKIVDRFAHPSAAKHAAAGFELAQAARRIGAVSVLKKKHLLLAQPMPLAKTAFSRLGGTVG